jgi:hypothetical protein
MVGDVRKIPLSSGRRRWAQRVRDDAQRIDEKQQHHMSFVNLFNVVVVAREAAAEPNFGTRDLLFHHGLLHGLARSTSPSFVTYFSATPFGAVVLYLSDKHG